MAFSYYSPITVNAAQVPSTQTNFPMLVSVTDARFKTVSNGGHVQNASGFDIRPYTDTTLTTAITGYELERFNASTGEVVMWVKIASLSSSTTPVVLAYGDSSLTTDGSSTTTWSNSFVSVYHLKDGTTLSATDSVGFANGSLVNTPTAAAGQIDGAASFASASTQYISLGTGIHPAIITLSAWIKATSFPGAYNSVIARTASGDNWAIYAKSTGKAAYFAAASSVQRSVDPGTATMSTGTWYFIAMTVDGTNLKTYLNAASDGTTTGIGLSSVTNLVRIASDAATAGREFNGVIDEVRVASVVRAADWITTEYNNQNAPGTFETLGSEVQLVVPGSTSRFFMLFN